MTIAYPCWAAHCLADSSSSSRLLYWLGGRGAIELGGGGEISGEMGIWSSGDPGLRTPNMTEGFKRSMRWETLVVSAMILTLDGEVGRVSPIEGGK